jgi:hypothetical protein
MVSSEDLNTQLLALTETPEADRSPDWEMRFFQALTSSSLELLTPDPQQGPDGWPYILARTSVTATEPAQKIIQWASLKGIGLVINPQKDYPDYVFSYGMLWSFKETGYFFRPVADEKNNDVKDGTVEFNPASIQHAGTPTPQYLPDYARKILREFFRDQGVLAPKILLISQDRVNYELAISLESLGNPPSNEHAGVAEAIGWFLPPHYSLILVSAEGLPEFSDL